MRTPSQGLRYCTERAPGSGRRHGQRRTTRRPLDFPPTLPSLPRAIMCCGNALAAGETLPTRTGCAAGCGARRRRKAHVLLQQGVRAERVHDLCALGWPGVELHLRGRRLDGLVRPSVPVTTKQGIHTSVPCRPAGWRRGAEGTPHRPPYPAPSSPLLPQALGDCEAWGGAAAGGTDDLQTDRSWLWLPGV